MSSNDVRNRISHIPCVLVLDIGTTSARAAVFDVQGNMLAFSGSEYRSTYLDDGAIDHDPHTWLGALRTTIPQVLEPRPGCRIDVEAVVVVTQRSTILAVDASGNPLRPAVSWQDKRTQAQCATLHRHFGEDPLYRKTGLRIDPYFSLPKIMWMMQEPGFKGKQTSKFVTVHDWILHHLTGRFVTDPTQASRTLLFNIHQGTWDRDILSDSSISLDHLPEVVPTGSIVGYVTDEAAREFGLKAGVPVVAAGGDQPCSAIGLGVIRPGLAEVTNGTGSFLLAPVAAPQLDKDKRVLVSPAAISGQYMMEAGLFTTGSVFRWLRDLTASHLGDSSVTYEELVQEAAEVPVGANGLLVIPHWAGSAAPYWNPDARGVIWSLSLQHGRPSIARAVLEGIAVEISKNLDIMDALLGASSERNDRGKQIEFIHASGGLSKGDLFNCIQADVYGRNVVAFQNEQSTARGAAVLGLVAVGAVRDVASACAEMMRTDDKKTYVPSPDHHAVYQRIRARHDQLYRVLTASENLLFQ